MGWRLLGTFTAYAKGDCAKILSLAAENTTETGTDL